MLDPDLVAALSAAKYLPVPEMRAALAEPHRIADAVLDVLDRVARDPDLREADADLLFWGLHVLAAAQDTRAYRPLIRLLYRDGETLDAILGDALTTTLTKVLIGVFDGDAEPLFTLLVDSTVDGVVRNEAFGVLAFLTQIERIPRRQAHDLLVRFDDKRAAVEGDLAWAGWEEAIALLGLAELAPRVSAARQDGRLTAEISDPSWFPGALREAIEIDDPARFDRERFGILDDPVAELAWTAEGFGQPVRNPLKHVGRNDPCPCGSGKKFKKCCLDKAVA
ncbi:zinc chelation protein SecC [Methylobacterium sp. Leaf104]|uniref:DUF1186 domain-containing protein n=1 Tax=Methylobacterium TaxID=407 RepID=UPI0006F8DA2C|nr:MULTISPECIES: DUF1186 domain-containing protein [Methylobacterium]KQP31262.1 zinc chelation protein SecC [Methylobacterium sp. Leaf104]MCI9881366.1 DUF1186 domain-containing protein [Methylobacterium goesingense]